MKQSISVEATLLYQQASIIADNILRDKDSSNREAEVPADFQNDFFAFLGRINGHLMEDKDNFFGYFLFQMTKSIRFDLASPTGVNFKGTRYQIHFNPLLFLTLSPEQMESTIKHEILHVVSLHLIRAKELRENYSKQAITLAMDVVVNTYLDHLPPFSTTLEWVNTNFSLLLKPFESLEYYVDKIQTALDIRTENKNLPEPESDADETVAVSYNPITTHELWDENDVIDDETLKKFTEKYVDASSKGDLSNYLESMIKALKDNKDSLPWHWYLKKLIGSVTSSWKRTPMRRNRRQPDRLDLPGKLRSHTAKILVGLEDVKGRLDIRGGTAYSPVFDYANTQNIDLLVYFTDGKGEEKLQTAPRGYKVLWVLSGHGETLSLKNPYGLVKRLAKLPDYDPSLDFDDVRGGGFSMANQEHTSKL